MGDRREGQELCVSARSSISCGKTEALHSQEENPEMMNAKLNSNW